MNSLAIKKQQAGITLIEVSIGLIIAAIVAAIAFIAFQNNSRRNEVRENVQAITEIVAETQQKFGRTDQFVSLTGNGYIADGDQTDPAVVSSTVPAKLAKSNSYGGKVYVKGAADGNTATLIWEGVPASQCYDLIAGVEQALVNATVGGEYTAGGAVTGDASFGAAAIPVFDNPGAANAVFNAATATTECGKVTATTTLSFTFTRG